MIRCLTDGARLETDRAIRNHLAVMAKLEDFLGANPGRPLYLSEICAATNASERMIRLCCQEHLGIGPVRYLWLRRMHLARRALLTASEGRATVTSIAMAHGFWELGRFSVAYRGLFGETPLTTLRRPADDAPQYEILPRCRDLHSRTGGLPTNSAVRSLRRPGLPRNAGPSAVEGGGRMPELACTLSPNVAS